MVGVGAGVGEGATTNSANEVLHDFHINAQAWPNSKWGTRASNLPLVCHKK